MRQTKLIILLIAVSAFLAAQTDPSGRVGRLNYTNGPVSFQAAGVTDWVAFQFLNLDDQTIQIQLSQGTLAVRVRNLAQDRTSSSIRQAWLTPRFVPVSAGLAPTLTGRPRRSPFVTETVR